MHPTPFHIPPETGLLQSSGSTCLFKSGKVSLLANELCFLQLMSYVGEYACELVRLVRPSCSKVW